MLLIIWKFSKIVKAYTIICLKETVKYQKRKNTNKLSINYFYNASVMVAVSKV